MLAVANRLGVQRPLVYGLVGVAAWVLMLKSGVHATVAGVLVALTVPATRRMDEAEFSDRAGALLARFREGIAGSPTDPSPDQMAAVHSLEVACEQVEAPLTRLEHGLHGWVAFGVMPVFALANAGVALDGVGALVTDAVALGVLLGLVVGKPLGVVGLAWLAVKTGLAALPSGVTWGHVLGVSLLTGDRVHDVDLHRRAGVRARPAPRQRQGGHPGRVGRLGRPGRPGPRPPGADGGGGPLEPGPAARRPRSVALYAVRWARGSGRPTDDQASATPACPRPTPAASGDRG